MSFPGRLQVAARAGTRRLFPTWLRRDGPKAGWGRTALRARALPRAAISDRLASNLARVRAGDVTTDVPYRK